MAPQSADLFSYIAEIRTPNSSRSINVFGELFFKDAHAAKLLIASLNEFVIRDLL